MLPYERTALTAEELSFEWLHCRFLLAGSKASNIFYSIANCAHDGKILLSSIYLNGHTVRFYQ